MAHAKQRWSQLSPASRAALLSGAALDLGLRCWALVDLVKRPQEQVKGSKAAWAIGLGFVNSLGVLPTAYLAWARTRGQEADDDDESVDD